MDGIRTRGHPIAVAAVGAMIAGRMPHAVLLVGPAGIGKTTLAGDLAAGLLCTAEPTTARPCGVCRACRLVASGGHPDVHRLGPDGPGRQVVIGGPGARQRGIRDLITELALLPVEGGARVAIIEGAHRMNEDAQAALLKTLEEPPQGVCIVLCADAEEPLLPTIRSRCARIRLGPVGSRDIETMLADLGVADPPLAARLARISGGRPGLAVAWARDPDALLARDEISRTLLDLIDLPVASRLAAVRAAAGRAGAIATVGDRVGDAVQGGSNERAPAARRPRRTGGAARTGGLGAGGAADATAEATAEATTDATPDRAPDDRVPDRAAGSGDDPEAVDPSLAVRTPAAERRRAAEALVLLWADVARDVAIARSGPPGATRDLALLDETAAAAARLDPAAIVAFLDRVGRATVLLGSNVSPELVLDDLALAWPRALSAVA